MSAAVTDTDTGAILRRAAIGFHGKIPARGDFVGAGLPRSFVEPWDNWMQQALAASRALLGEDWTKAWLEAPVWRFALTPGICGPDPVLGLWLPSIDRVGRHYPLTLAAVAPDAKLQCLIAEGGGFLGAAEPAGREALADDLPPETLAVRIAAAADTAPADPGTDARRRAPVGALWWTEGGPFVAACDFTTDRLPDEARFVAMLDDRANRP
jgi:type VI secretion system protein ImpM